MSKSMLLSFFLIPLALLIGGGASATTPTQGPWWSPSESGRGYDISVQGDTIVLTAFIYDRAGNPTFYQAVGTFNHATNSATMPYAEFHGGQCFGCAYRQPSATKAGDMTITFDTMNTGTIRYPGGSSRIQAMVFGYAGKSDYFLGAWSLTLAGGYPANATEWVIFDGHFTGRDGTEYVAGRIDGNPSSVALARYAPEAGVFMVITDDGAGYQSLYMFFDPASNDHKMIGAGAHYLSSNPAPSQPDKTAIGFRIFDLAEMQGAAANRTAGQSRQAGALMTGAPVDARAESLAGMVQAATATLSAAAVADGMARFGQVAPLLRARSAADQP